MPSHSLVPGSTGDDDNEAGALVLEAHLKPATFTHSGTNTSSALQGRSQPSSSTAGIEEQTDIHIARERFLGPNRQYD